MYSGNPTMLQLVFAIAIAVVWGRFPCDMVVMDNSLRLPSGALLTFEDVPGSQGLDAILREIAEDHYRLAQIPLSAGDVVLDIGANVGVFSIYLAALHPGLRILAFEPVPETFAALRRNLRRNGIRTVEAHNLAVNGDGRPLELRRAPGNSGGATALPALDPYMEASVVSCPGISLDEIFRRNGVDRCRLLKIDCEGGEYEILQTTEMLSRVDYLRGEFHISPGLRETGESISSLLLHCARSIDPARISVQGLELCEVDGRPAYRSYGDVAVLMREYLARAEAAV